MKNSQISTQKRREEKRVTEIRADISMSHEASEDVTLPDYYPEIRKIVFVSARVLPESKFVSDCSVEAEGSISWSIYYIGEDSKLTFAPALTHYTMNTQLPVCQESGGLSLDTRIETETCRAVAKRKLNLKARLRSHIIAESERSLEENVSFADSSNVTAADLITLEKQTSTVSAMRRFTGEGTRSVSAQLTIPDEASAVGCDALISRCESKARDGAVNIAGEATVYVITASSDGKYSHTELSIPFAEEIAANGVLDGDMCRAWGRCVSASISSNDGGATVDVELELEFETCRNEEAAATLDAFSTSAEATLELSEIVPVRALRCRENNVSINETLKRKNQGSPDEYLAFSSFDGRVEKCEVLDGKLIISGSVQLKAVFADENDAQCEEYSIPFKYECDGKVSAGDVIWRGEASISGASVKQTADENGGKLIVRCEVELCVTVIEKCRITAVESVKLTRNAQNPASDLIVICYPEQNETLWDIAKKYRVSPNEISRLNGGGAPEVGKPLLIR